jgi:FkbM family methyltransferase
VIDGGVAYGTPELYGHFPGARYLLVEPLHEFEPHIRAIMRNFDAIYAPVALGAREGQVTLMVKPRITGSSIFQEVSTSVGACERRQVRMMTLDDLCASHHLEGPYLLKLDLEGAELDALESATHVLMETEVAILEVSFIAKLANIPEFGDVVTYLGNRGFRVYDIVNLRNQLPSGILFQADVLFVKEDSFLRRF